MDERETDKLLADLFERNAPTVNEPAVGERISAKLMRRRRRSRRSRTTRTVALGFVSIVLAVAAALGTYGAVEHFHNQARFFFIDLVPTPGDAALGWGTGNPSGMVRVSPVMGTAVLEQVKSEGTSEPTGGAGGTRWVRGRVEVYRLSMSQPAINGTVVITSDLGRRLDGSTDVQGSWVLRTSRGTWQGSSWTGNVTADGADQFCFGKAAGAGGFTGLLLLLQWHVARTPGSLQTAGRSSEAIVVSGWIQAAK